MLRGQNSNKCEAHERGRNERECGVARRRTANTSHSHAIGLGRSWSWLGLRERILRHATRRRRALERRHAAFALVGGPVRRTCALGATNKWYIRGLIVDVLAEYATAVACAVVGAHGRVAQVVAWLLEQAGRTFARVRHTAPVAALIAKFAIVALGKTAAAREHSAIALLWRRWARRWRRLLVTQKLLVAAGEQRRTEALFGNTAAVSALVAPFATIVGVFAARSAIRQRRAKGSGWWWWRSWECAFACIRASSAARRARL